MNLKSLTKRDFSNLMHYEDQQSQCRNCRGNRDIGCRKYSVSVDGDGNLTISSAECEFNQRTLAEKKIKSLLKSAKVPRRFCNIRAGKDFIITEGNRNAALLAEQCILNDGGLYMYGTFGVGKTMLACVIVNERAILNKISLFLTVPDMLEELRDFEHNEQRKKKIELLYSVPCLIVDDLGAEKLTTWAGETLFRIFNQRYNDNLQTIVTSNFSLNEIGRRFEDVYNGGRVVRRIREMCQEIQVKFR